MNLPDYDTVCRAAERISAHLTPTPVRWWRGGGGLLKLENLQATGAYKVRGALNALLTQVERGDRRPVVAASAGNHSAGMAWAARRLGLTATAVVPETAPRRKIETTRALGAEVIVAGADFEAAEQHAISLAHERDWRFLHPFDDPDVIAGQGSLALELLTHRPDRVLVPIGGGGLASGIALVMAQHRIPVYGVQVEGVDAMRRVLDQEAPLQHVAPTIADGVRVARPGQTTARICAAHLETVLTVTEAEVTATMGALFFEEELVVEGAGAVAVAAVNTFSGGRTCAIVSGGNIDPATFAQVLKSRYGRHTLTPERYNAASRH